MVRVGVMAEVIVWVGWWVSPFVLWQLSERLVVVH